MVKTIKLTAKETEHTAEEEEEFTQIRVRVSTRDQLKTLCPKKAKLQYFADDFIRNAMEHRDILSRVLSSAGQ